ncbi:MAG: hypothetical protein AB7F22_33395 [Reyranella sp.]|uniref:hypothetical protein n=1 Tax=Reyranella sp. TaxID=1929291 RepID=UPI003D0A1D4E
MAKRKEAKTGWDRIDPYVSWALGPGRDTYFAPGRAMSLLLRLKGEFAREFLEGAFIAGARFRAKWRDAFWVLGRRAESVTGRDLTVWAGALATRDIVEAMASTKARRAIESVSLGPPLSVEALPILKKSLKPRARRRNGRRVGRSVGAGGKPPAVVMGIVDDGIAFANERFLKDVGGVRETRVEYCWLQEPGLLPGTILTKSTIDSLLISCGGDEELFYRRAGLFEFAVPGRHQSAAWRVAHGTHVMDLACGFDPQDQIDDRPIVCVHLPTSVTAAQVPGRISTPGTLYFHIASAITYIVERALDVAATYGVAALPVVINLSYGLLADPHDGTGGLEAFIEAKIAEYLSDHGGDLRVVLPAGNGYLSRVHGQTSFTAVGQTKRFEWRIPPDDRTPSYLEVWLPAPIPASSRMALGITSPAGASIMTFEGGPMVHLGTASGYYAWGYWSPWTPSNRSRFTVILQATAEPDPGAPVAQLAPAGIWKIDLVHTGGLAATDLVHVWIRRDDRIFGFPLRGRQSFLSHADYERFDNAGRDLEIDNTVSLVRRESTINSMATGTSTIVIGGYLGKEKKLAKYTAAGKRPLSPPPPPPPELVPRWPDAAAVSEDSQVHSGVLAAGTRSGSIVAMGGTSVAAPQISRLVADDLANSGLGDKAMVQLLALVGLPSPERSGAGGIPTAPIVKVKRFD